MKKLTFSAAILFLSVLVGCGGSGQSANTGTVLQSIQISPGTASVAAGLGQQFTATGKYSDGSSRDLTQSATWASSDTNIATVTSGGMVSTKAAGSATITAKDSGVSGPGSLTVTAPNITSLVVSPTTPSIAAGTALQFTATGTFTDSSTHNVTASVQWTSSASSVASINLNGAQGLALGVAAGSSTITAASGNVSATATLGVTNATLNSIAVTPTTPSIPLGTLQQFTATGTFSDSTTQDITNTATWSSSNTNVAFITVSGVVTARNLGTTTITASQGRVTDSVSANVDASNLTSLAVTPANSTIAPSTSQQLTATGTFNDGSTHNLTTQVAWSSSDTTVATIGKSNGLAKAVATGSTTITATLGSATASTNLTISSATIVSISLTPTNQTVPPGSKLPYTATGSFSDSSTQNITRDVTWASDNTAVATINAAGVATGVAPGNANISATLNGVVGSTSLTVNSATLNSITVAPATSVLAPASTLFYGATGSYSDGSSRTITNAVVWSSSATNVASIVSSGQATGQSAGTANITAQQGSVTGTAALVVSASPLKSVQVVPANSTIAEKTSVRFQAIGTFEDSSTQNLTNSVIWTSSSASVATISRAPADAGTATGIAPGTTTITALFAGKTGTASLKVTNATLTSITISPSSTSIALGTSVQFAATGHFSDGSTQNLSTQVNWSSTDVSVATINSIGIASSVATGTTTINASMLSINGSATLTVF